MLDLFMIYMLNNMYIQGILYIPKGIKKKIEMCSCKSETENTD